MRSTGTSTNARVRVRSLARLVAFGAVSVGLLSLAHTAHAQIAGTANKPLPNVLLLVDNSGSMERMPDSSLPSANRNPPPLTTNVCSPGVQSNPNRWGMLLQALTGNLQPYFSCDAIDRSTPAFKNEFAINGFDTYDYQYYLPYHRPLAGNGAGNACTFAPYTLPGTNTGNGVGPLKLGDNTVPAEGYGTDPFVSVLNSHLKAQYALNAGLVNPKVLAPGGNGCLFDQAVDGQLDATRDYIRFALMTFDNDTNNSIGVTRAIPPGLAVVGTNPFLGQWSYVKSPTNPSGTLGFGLPGGCAGPATPFEVGARHWAAPPWEGRMVPFADPDGSLFDVQATNDLVQQVLLASRPYGATPIDGMLEDARDYLWYNDYGPLGTQPKYHDQYVQNSCRDQYIILLTDGAPNLDLRPDCTAPGGQCPFTVGATTAQQMATAVGNKKVSTFVIGFSVNGAGNTSFTNDGFPVGFNNCKAWFDSTGAPATATSFRTACIAANPPKTSTADACCTLNEIAYFGANPAGTVPPFFAETQADLVLSFGRILGNVSKGATTRTLPGYAPPVRYSSKNRTGEYIASFVPNARRPWSGELDRTRTRCDNAVPTRLTQDSLAGDSMAINLARQANARKRLIITAQVADTTGPTTTTADSARTMRPLMVAHNGSDLPGYADGITSAIDPGGTVLPGSDVAPVGLTTAAFNITNSTCKRSRATNNTIIPALTAAQCTEVVWGFTTATPVSLKYGGSPYEFNVRCINGAAADAGFCSVSGAACAFPGASCPVAGEVCVPQCSALGAIFRSSPVPVGAPTDLLRDEAFRNHSGLRAQRRPVMFVNTTDGLLHAFKSLATSDFPNDALTDEHELWAFAPPAVLPKLAANYPTGQQIVLDGTPSVKDIVWDRPQDANFALATAFHTTLVSGMGAGGPGYFGLNVTDVDCQGNASPTISSAPNGCLGGNYAVKSTYADIKLNPKGPQFLWQLTDIEAISPLASEKAKITRTAPTGQKMVALFGKESGNPILTTLNIDPDGGGVRQIGVAILPGGIDGPPSKTAACNRAINGGAPTPFPAATYDASDASRRPRDQARLWGKTCADPVPGRSVTIVRADTGAIIRHFGRLQQDVPQRIASRTTDSPFDSPIIGTPAIYPNQVGVATQKVFVGDADGTIWRINLTSTNPANWRVQLFQDLLSKDLSPAPTALDSEPIQIPMTLSQDPFGSIVINAATGDQENITAPPPGGNERNYLWAIQEQRQIDVATLGRAKTRWYQTLANGERVTGPMVAFDQTLYYATYTPIFPTSANCNVSGNPKLWGVDFQTPFAGNPYENLGGVGRWCPIGSVSLVTGSCTAGLPLPQFEPTIPPDPSLLGAIIPGVSIRESLACVEAGSGTDPAITGMSTTSFDLFFGATSKGTSAGNLNSPQAVRLGVARPQPRTGAIIDAWTSVIGD